jgi:hypothetical protein
MANIAGPRALIPPRETGILNVGSHVERRAPMREYEANLQNQPVDVSEAFARQQNHYFIGSKVLDFDPRSASGKILWKGLAPS